ncbi:hypothetical protein RND81_01G115300 [Saponaria officinalis]|uniref:Uncharacterized protein n=1 Tax=Saponaria officinalis TaxID=3572 RepID=A0AAW1N9G9_SAPOF
MRLSFASLDGVELYDGSSIAQHEVFNNEDLMNMIFDRVRRVEDKANMAVACKKWCQLFLFHPSAPQIDLAYRVSLNIHDIDGVRIFSKGSRIVYQRCKCFMTEDVNTKFMLHYIQHRNAFENSHLNDLDDIATRQVNEYYRSLATSLLAHMRAITGATHLLPFASLSYIDLPIPLDM